MRHTLSVLLLIFFVTPARPAQLASGFSGGAYPGVVTGKPYSAEQINETTQTLADGTHIRQPAFSVKIYRDSQGRTRTERTMRMTNAHDPATAIDIFDPISKVRYIFDSRSKVMHRQELPSVSARIQTRIAGDFVPGPPSTSVAPPKPHANGPSAQLGPVIKTEKLDSQVIEGLPAEGKRTTVTYPLDSIGNDREFATITEVWTSPDLNVILLNKSNDPRRGESITRLFNISRNEPDPSLFQPPAGYATIDQDTFDGISFTPVPRR